MLFWHWAWTHSKSSQATQPLPHNTGKDCSKKFSFEQTLVQGLPQPPASGSEQPPLLLITHYLLRKGTGHWLQEAPREQVPTAENFYLKKLNFDGALQITCYLLFPYKKTKSL